MLLPDQSTPMDCADLTADANASRAAFKVAVFAASGESAQRARQWLARLAARLKQGSELNTTFWQFELLTSPRLLDVASHDASTADLVMVAPETARDLPGPIKVLFERWARAARKGVVMLAGTADLESSGSAAVLNFFRQLAATWGFNFFCDADGLLPDFAQNAAPAAPLPRGGNLDPALLVNRHGKTPPVGGPQTVRAAG